MGDHEKFPFTFPNIRNQYEQILAAGYEIITCEQYFHLDKSTLKPKLLINRVDIDLSIKKAKRLADIFNELGIKASFFLRLHAPEYNPFSFENYKIIKYIIASGHELGYHSEIIDQAAIWNEDAADCLRRDIAVMEQIFKVPVKSVASHGGMTGLNNLDFWKQHKPKDFGLLYEAYEGSPEFNLFNSSFYVSDSEWTRWKCYEKGKLVAGDNRTPAEHLPDQHPLIYMLIHPDTYYDSHFYDNER